jgi:hypothetical protein
MYGYYQWNKMKHLFSLLLLLLPYVCAMATELPELDQALQFHGFLTQGYVKTTENGFFGDSEDGSFEFRELGFNTSYRFSPNIMASAQILSRNAGELYDGSVDLDYAQIDTAFYTANENRFGIIVGRYKNPFGLYNDTRDVAATRPGIFMPQAIYWDRVRNMMLHNDGALLFGNVHIESHRFYLQLFSGLTPIDENVEQTYISPFFDPDPELEQDGLTTGARLLYEWDGGRFTLAYSGANLQFDAKTDNLPPGSVEIDYRILSAQYNEGLWSLTFEYMQEPFHYSGFNGILNSLDADLDGYYVQGSYRLQDDIELFLRYEESHYDKEDTRGEKTGLKFGQDPHNFYSRQTTLGLLWEITERWIFRTEFSQVDGTIFLSHRDNPNTEERERNWNLFSMLVSYSF